MAIPTRLTDLLGIEHPILLAPMGSASGGALAAAVTAAGGFGFIGSGYADSAKIRAEMAAAGNARIGVGLVTWALADRPEALDAALEHAPPAVMLSFGDPTPYAGRVKQAGSLLFCQVQTLEMAKQAADAGADVIIAQGRDAGGHAASVRGTFGLVPAVVDAVAPIPVVAAGAVADGRGLAAALMLGAEGVLMGTRFAASAESDWHDALKQGAVAAAADDTLQTRVFDVVRGVAWPTHFPGRAVRNDFSARWHGREDELAARRAEVNAGYDATAAGDLSTRVLWAGEGVDLVSDVPSARDIVARTVAEAERAMAGRRPG
ncbi:2-nitropropane dioxygenase [Thalassobaculum fulvum]|uniref:2-nitropropane dioxygenase n=1 Tax=Thalassobaculum fulvum TaxID=1633335 RepID=A0A918XW81_9PROT|nr:nitronate monooxygenase [Thalassobaculum fulvum]GHD57756.1 2-nitropropane dioxygenase [Thalassobaculum fulvum]